MTREDIFVRLYIYCLLIVMGNKDVIKCDRREVYEKCKKSYVCNNISYYGYAK